MGIWWREVKEICILWADVATFTVWFAGIHVKIAFRLVSAVHVIFNMKTWQISSSIRVLFSHTFQPLLHIQSGVHTKRSDSSWLRLPSPCPWANINRKKHIGELKSLKTYNQWKLYNLLWLHIISPYSPQTLLIKSGRGPSPIRVQGKKSCLYKQTEKLLGRSLQNVIRLQSGNCRTAIVLFPREILRTRIKV